VAIIDDILCTFGLLDDVTFAHNGLYGAWLRGRIVKLTLIGAPGGKKITPSPLSSRELCDRQTPSNALS